MKKVFLSLVLLLLASFSQAKLEPMWNQIFLQVKIVDPTVHDEPIGRSPVHIPSLSLEEYNLLFHTSCDGCTLRILNEDGDIEYSILIPENTTSMTLPSYLHGECKIQLIRGQFCFYGYVEF